jgi:hypothetical protein
VPTFCLDNRLTDGGKIVNLTRQPAEMTNAYKTSVKKSERKSPHWQSQIGDGIEMDLK